MSATIPNHPGHAHPGTLLAVREEIQLFQEESLFFQRLLRRSPAADKSSKVEALQERLRSFRKETLPSLYQAFRSLETQSANATQADNGESHFQMFQRNLNAARHQMNSLKREALCELNRHAVPVPIW